MTLFFVIVIIGMGAWLRFDRLGILYSDIDDSGVISVYKDWLPHEKPATFLVQNAMFELSYRIHSEYQRDHLLDSFFYFIHMGRSWTYPLGQYVFYPLLIQESDDYSTKLTKARSVSAVFGVLGLVLFTYLLFILNDRQWTPRLLLPLCLFTFSFNAVMYAHHMSPYVAMVTVYVLALLAFYYTLQNRLSITGFYSLLAVLTVFNYLIALLCPVFGVLLLFKFRLKHPLDVMSRFWKAVCIYGGVFVVVDVFFIRNASGLSSGIPPLSFMESPVRAFWQIVWLFFDAMGSVAASVTVDSVFNVGVAVFIVFFGAVVLYRKRDELQDLFYVYLSVFLLFFVWVLFYQSGLLIIAPSRHVLMWGVGLSALFFLILGVIRLPHWITFFLTVLFIGCSFSVNLQLLRERETVFDFEYIEQLKPSYIVTLYNRNTVLYFEKSLIPVRFVSSVDVLNDLYEVEKKVMPDVIHVVSQLPIEDIIKSYTRENIPLLNEYDLLTLKEVPSRTTFLYNNALYGTLPNAFYVYELIKKV